MYLKAIVAPPYYFILVTPFLLQSKCHMWRQNAASLTQPHYQAMFFHMIKTKQVKVAGIILAITNILRERV